MDEHEELLGLETGLWQAQTRFDRAWMEDVLDPAFFEFGRSGRVYAREDTLAAQARPLAAQLRDYEVHRIADDVRLCTYVSDVDGELGNRSSLWVRADGRWRLRFHQGTPLSNVELARRGFEAWQRGDLDAIAALLDEGVRWHGGDPDAEGACRNRGEALAFMRRAMDSGVTLELVEFTGAGDKVVVVHARGANVTTFRDGRIVEMVHYPDRRDAFAAAQLGETPSRSRSPA